MPARRCSICALDWPLLPAYRFCPQCNEKTSPASNIDAMDEKEAYSLKASFKFEKFYKVWDEMHPDSRLDPT